MSDIGISKQLRDILCFSSTDWQGVWGSRQQIMQRLARRGHRILYIERPVGPEHLLRYPDFRQLKLRRWREGLVEIEAGLWIVSLPLLLPGRYYSPSINRLNQSLTRIWTRQYLNRLGMTPSLLWLYKPEHGPLVGKFGERLSVYHCIDEFSAGTRGRKRQVIRSLETDLLQRVDLVFANSQLTVEDKLQTNPHTYRIPSAADVDHFSHALDPATPLHPAIAGLPHPLAGFLGNLAERIDTALLGEVARLLPGWNFVFVGQVYPQLVDLAPLTGLPNVHLLGRFPFGELPGLVKGMDVFMLPYVLDERARFRSPLKLYEYLAAGHPIVSTPHSEVAEMGELVRFADSAQSFAAQLQAALHESPENVKRRLAMAKNHSWDTRLDQMEAILAEHINIPAAGSHAPHAVTKETG